MSDTRRPVDPFDAGPARTAGRAADAEPSGSHTAASTLRAKPWGIRVYRAGRRILRIAPVASLVFAAFIAGVALFYELRQSGTPVIGTISVPQALQTRGYTPDVVARKIGDAYRRISADANTSIRRVAVSVRDSSGDILVPTDSTSVYALGVRVIRFLRITSRREISGELTEDPAGKLSLTLRLDGEGLTTGGIGPMETPEELLEPAAVAIMRRVQPYVVASWLHERDPEAGKQAALELLRLLPETDPNAIRAHVLLAYIHSQRGETDLAIQEYQTAIRLDPKNADPHINLGLLHTERGATDLAVQEYQIAIRLNPKTADPHINLGIVFAERGETDLAVQEYQTAIRLDPKTALPHINLGIVLAKRGETDLAIQEYQTAIRLDPKTALPHINLGLVHAERGATDLAIQEYQTAIRLDPDKAAPHINLGLVHTDRGATDLAVQEYQTAIRLDPKDAAPHIYVGNVHRERGETDLAIQEYQTAIRIDPNAPSAHYNLALTLIEKTTNVKAGATRQRLLSEACSHAVAGARLLPDDADYSTLMQNLNRQAPPCKLASPTPQ